MPAENHLPSLPLPLLKFDRCRYSLSALALSWMIIFNVCDHFSGIHFSLTKIIFAQLFSCYLLSRGKSIHFAHTHSYLVRINLCFICTFYWVACKIEWFTFICINCDLLCMHLIIIAVVIAWMWRPRISLNVAS